mgnify:CR=1 FL=1
MKPLFRFQLAFLTALALAFTACDDGGGDEGLGLTAPDGTTG